jgi:hypothetical protein
MSSPGLGGYYGHTLVTDEDGYRDVEYQFRVLRRLQPRRWVVQLYSFLDGSPGRLAAYPEDFLLSDEVALYRDEETWLEWYAKYAQQSARRYRIKHGIEP